MSERFLIEAKNTNGIPITPPQDTRSEEGYMKDLTIEGILEILSGGEIKNATDTYRLTENGLILNGSTYNASGSAIVWNDGGSVVYGTIVAGDISGQRVLTISGNGTGGVIRFVLGPADPDEEPLKIYPTYLQVGLGKQLRVIDTTDSTSKDTGSIITEGGLGVEKSVFAGGKIVTADTTEATSTTTGAMRTAGGLGVAKNVHIGGILVAPTVSVAGITDADSPYSVPTSVSYIATDSSTGGITVNLPTGTDGRKITIFDTNGSAITNAITINRAGSDTINGSTNIQLTNPYESITLVCYSGNWTII